MKKLLVSLALFAVASLSAGDVVIATKGQAQADIVISSHASACVKFAAEELKQYLDKITGGDFKITSQPTTREKIHLGQSPEAEAAGLKPEALKQDGFFISAKGNDVFIVGVDDPSSVKEISYYNLLLDTPNRATLLGVYEFLEELGVRWPVPGPSHEFVPKIDALKISEGTQKIEPFFQDRQVPALWESYPDAKEYGYKVSSNDIYLWSLRMKLSGRGMLNGCHSEYYLKRPDDAVGIKTLWADHPERFALIKGERNPRYSCWTDPAVAEMWKKAADAYFSGRTPADAGLPYLTKPSKFGSWPSVFSCKDAFMIHAMDHNSTCDGRCRCPRCNTFREKYPCADDSEIIWKVIAEVAEGVKVKYPGKFITTLVYPPTMNLPKYTKIPDNVLVRICILGPIDIPTPNRLKPDMDLVKSWSKALGKKPPLWTYQCEAAFGQKLPGMPETYPHLIAEFLKLSCHDIAGMSLEQHVLSQTIRNLDMYIAARMLWNPDRDIEQELADYFKAYYGPAAEPSQKLFKRFEDNWVKYWKMVTLDKPKSESIGLGSPAKELQKIVWTKIYSPDEMKNIDAMVDAVEKAAAAEPVYTNRAKLLRKWIFDIMKAERSEVMDKEEARQKIVVHAPSVQVEPTTADWQKAPINQLVSAIRLKPQLAAGGKFQLLRFGGALHLRAELKEPKLADSLTKKDRPRGDNEVWRDNDLEIFLYSCAKKDLWQIIVNDQGNWASQRINVSSAAWLPLEGFNAKVQPSVDGWSVEAAIPLAQLGAGELRFNLTRNRQVKGQPEELSTWSPLAKVGNWHEPDNYGTIVND